MVRNYSKKLRTQTYPAGKISPTADGLPQRTAAASAKSLKTTTMTDNFQALDDTRHMLQWLADEPYEEIRSSVESILREQVADSRLIDFAVTSEPDWLTVGTRSPDNPDAIILNRTATAFEFCLHVSGGGQVHELHGVYTWAAWHLDHDGEGSNQRVWFDIGGTLAEFGKDGKLPERLNEGR